MFTSEQLEKIFARIGLTYTPGIPCDFDTMAAVQLGFQYTVPYENLDIIRGVPLSLDYNDLFEKIVTNHRGGYCFEINGFLGMFLRALGYEVIDYMARYLQENLPMLKMRKSEGTYMVWVDFRGTGMTTVSNSTNLSGLMSDRGA